MSIFSELGLDVDALSSSELGEALSRLVKNRVITLDTAFLLLDLVYDAL